MAKQTKWSYSRLDTYRQCPFEYYLKYIKGFYPKSATPALEVGTLTHKTEEAIGNALIAKKKPDYIGLKNEYIIAMERFKYRYGAEFGQPDKTGKTYQQKEYGYLRQGIYRLESFLTERPELSLIGCEIPIDYDYKGKRFCGSIDRAFKNRETGTYLIQDIKTWPQPHSKKELAQPLQFAIYSMAFAEANGCGLSHIACQYDLPFCDERQTIVNENYVHDCEKIIDGLFAGIEAEDFKPNPTPLCHWCPYCATNPDAPKEMRGLCPFFMLWTKTNKTFKKNEEWTDITDYESRLRKYEKERQ